MVEKNKMKRMINELKNSDLLLLIIILSRGATTFIHKKYPP